MTAGAFYTRDGDRFVPTGLGVSPWNGSSQNGVALAGLVAHVLAAVPSPTPMHTTRLTIDILGAVPMVPLQPAHRVLREGKRLQLVEIDLAAGDRSWVRVSAVRMRTEPSPVVEPASTRPFVASSEPTRPNAPWETRRVEGNFDTPGPGARWIRFAAPIVAGVELTPLERIAMLSDFGSGCGPLLPIKEWSFANIDISLHLLRLPRGEWLLADAVSHSAGNGIGITHSRLSDREGLIGLAHQTMFLDRRAARRA